MLMLKRALAVIIVGVSAVNCMAGENKGKIKTGRNYITNGLVKIDVRTPPKRHRVFFSVWNEKKEAWTVLFSGALGLGSRNAYEVLSNEHAEETKTEKTGETASLTFRLTDWTKDKNGKGGDGQFYQVYKITIRAGKNGAHVELVDGAGSGTHRTAWAYLLLPDSAKYLVGKNVYGGKDFVDCSVTFREQGKTIQINAGNAPVGAYNPENGYLYLVHQPKRRFMLAHVRKSGVVLLYPGTDSYTLYGKNIGKGREPNYVLELARKILKGEQ